MNKSFYIIILVNIDNTDNMNKKQNKNKIFKNVINNDNFINNDDMNDIEVPKPIPSKYDVLLNDEMDEFEKFKKNIMDDDSIDKDMKRIMIKSRFDIINKHSDKNKSNIESAFRTGIASPIIVKLKDSNFNKINFQQKEHLLKQIDNWVNGKISVVRLDSEILYEIYELIDNIKSIRIDIDDLKIKKIFEPKNPNDYIEFENMMKIIKIQSIKEEEERIKRKLEKEKMEEEERKLKLEEENKRIKEIEIRKNSINKFTFNLNKLSPIDIKTKLLKEQIEIHINNYLELKTEYIELNSDEIFYDLNKFINSIRMTKEEKDIILNKIKVV